MECRYCGKEFEPKKRGRKNTGFCCKKCRDSYRSHYILPEREPKYIKVCEQCGREYGTNREDQKYCGEECSRAARKTGRTVYVKTCLYCGEEFETVNKKQRFCTSTCGSRYYGDLRRGTYYCEYCGKERFSDHPNSHRFCSPECARKARMLDTYEDRMAKKRLDWLAHEKDCELCGKPFHATTLNQIYCSKECCDEAQRLNHRARYEQDYQPIIFRCAECGAPVVTSLGDRRRIYCSEECMNRAENRAHKQARKAQMRQAFVEQVPIHWTYKRAGGVCGICGLPVPDDRTPENPWGVTRDHIVPLSKGGLHEKSNCQLAHRLCNSIKLDALDEDFTIDWKEKLREEPGRWNELLDDLWEQLGDDCGFADDEEETAI